MDNAGTIGHDLRARRAPASDRKAAAIYLMWGSLLVFRGLADLKLEHSHATTAFFVVGVCLPLLGGFVSCVLGFFLIFGTRTIGTVDYEQVVDSRTEQRVRVRYASELDQLSSLGFTYAFTTGESVAPVRLLMIFPAFILVRARANGAVLALGRGGRIVLAAPVLNSADGLTFANPQSLGVSFYTALRNGTLLVTKNYRGLCCDTPQCVMQSSEQTIAEAWQNHKQTIDKLSADGNTASKDRSYQAYADIAHRSDSAIESGRCSST